MVPLMWWMRTVCVSNFSLASYSNSNSSYICFAFSLLPKYSIFLCSKYCFNFVHFSKHAAIIRWYLYLPLLQEPGARAVEESHHLGTDHVHQVWGWCTWSVLPPTHFHPTPRHACLWPPIRCGQSFPLSQQPKKTALRTVLMRLAHRHRYVKNKSQKVVSLGSLPSSV